MNYYILLFIIFLLILFFYISYNLYIFLVTDGRYRLYKFRPFPKRYEEILKREFPFYEKIPQKLKRNLKACILTFIKEKEFVGVGIEIDEEKKVIVAANACMLTIGLDRCEYKHVKTIFLYPDTIVKSAKIQNGWLVTEKEEVILGEAWQGGEVVLSWRDLVEGNKIPNDGKNVGFHEFAHQLDMEDGIPDGTPPLPLKLYPKWSRVMKKEYEKIKRLYERGKRAVLDRYAITSPAEFFAVATELFFEKPKKLKAKEPELYELLKEYYKIDPASW